MLAPTQDRAPLSDLTQRVQNINLSPFQVPTSSFPGLLTSNASLGKIQQLPLTIYIIRDSNYAVYPTLRQLHATVTFHVFREAVLSNLNLIRSVVMLKVGRLSRDSHAGLYQQFKSDWGVPSMPTVQDTDDWEEFQGE